MDTKVGFSLDIELQNTKFRFRANTELVEKQILDQPVGKSAEGVTGTRELGVTRSDFSTTVSAKLTKQPTYNTQLDFCETHLVNTS